MKKVEEEIYDIAHPVVTDNGMDLVDVEYVKEGQNWYLRLYIDKENGVSIDDCQLISEKVGTIIDEKDPIKTSYFLEVSSPGIERKLKKDSDFEKYKGSKVEIKLYKPIDGSKAYIGELVGLIDQNVTIIEEKKGQMSFNKEDVSQVKTVFEF